MTLFSTAKGKWILIEVYIVENRKSKYVVFKKGILILKTTRFNSRLSRVSARFELKTSITL